MLIAGYRSACSRVELDGDELDHEEKEVLRSVVILHHSKVLLDWPDHWYRSLKKGLVRHSIWILSL